MSSNNRFNNSDQIQTVPEKDLQEHNYNTTSQRNNENAYQSCLNSTKISTISNHSRSANDFYNQNQNLESHLQTFDLNRHHVRQLAVPAQVNNYSNVRFNQMHERGGGGDELNFTNSSTSSNHFNSHSEENERLKSRILILEQQIVNQSRGSVLQHQPVNLMDARLKDIESSTALLRHTLENEKKKEDFIKDLEDLLCRREYEIEELNKKFKEDKAELERKLFKQQNNEKKAEEEIMELKNHLSNSKKVSDSKSVKLGELESYLKILPTAEEYKSTNGMLLTTKNENEKLKSELELTNKRLAKAKTLLKQLQEKVENFEQKLKEKDQDREKLQNEYDIFRNKSKDVVELVDLRKENAKLKADNDSGRKLIMAHREQIVSIQTKHQEEICSLQEKLRIESDSSIGFRQEIENKERMISELIIKNKEFSDYNQILVDTNLDNLAKIKSFETVMNREYQNLLKQLCVDLDFSKNKLNNLVENCIKLEKGEDFDISSLVYDSRTYSNSILTDEDQDQVMSGVLTPEYLRNTIKDLKVVQENLDLLRIRVSNYYAEKIGDKLDCCIQ